MNKQRKEGAPFSAPGRRTDAEDGRSSFATAKSLNDFLVRRQLLAMESKRIEALLAEAEDAVKAKQNEFPHLRDRAFAFVRDHLAQMEQLVQVERLKQKRTLRDLPKTAERYVRQKGKQLLTHARRPSTESDSEPASRWLLPKVRELDAWASWFAEYDPLSQQPAIFRKDRTQVALVVSGGIGDLLKSTHLVGPISNHFSCEVTLITDQRAADQIVEHNPYVSDTLTVRAIKDLFVLADCFSHTLVFDLIILWRYSVNYVRPAGSRIRREDIEAIESSHHELQQILEKYSSLLVLPRFNYVFAPFSREVSRLGLSALKVGVATSSRLRGNTEVIPFFPQKKSLRVIAGLVTQPYVTVHHGFDVNSLPARTRETDYQSTKNISIQQWREIVSLVRKKGLEVIQLGVVEDEKIEGVTRCLNGQTTLEETSLLIKFSLCHIDTEGGLVHLANAVHARCVVLFGPTPAAFFGYPQNINLEPSGCKNCWFATKNWLIECPRHTSGPECMREHSATSVADAVDKIIAERESISVKLIAVEKRPSAASFAEALAKAETLLDRDAEDRILMILNEPPRTIGPELPDGLLDQCDVIVCGDKLADLEPNDCILGRFEYGSLLNLSRASSSVDAAVWVVRGLESDIAAFALSEIFRILKPDGQLVFVVIGETTALDLPRSLSAARIAFDEGGMPSAPVYAGSLRKGAVRREDHPLRSRPKVSTGYPEAAQGVGVDPRLAPLEEENARQIALVRDRYAHRERVVAEMHAVVDDAIQRGFGRDGWIWISNDFADAYLSKFFIRGWHQASESVIWSRETEDKCVLMAPYPGQQASRGESLELQLHLTIPEASASSPRTIGVRVDDGPVDNISLATDDMILTIPIATDSSRFRGVSLIEFHFGGEIGDRESERPHDLVRIGVKRFRYGPLRS
jgi:ADP-heptose:LPS heptosyltransferase